MQHDSDQQYIYSSRSNASGLFHAFFSNEISQTSWFTVTKDGVRPDRYRGDDGSSKTARDISLDFNWETGRATGVAEDKAVDVALEPGTQDDMSIQIALMYALLKDQPPSSLHLIDKDRIKEYLYTSEGTAHLKTALGELDTVVYRSQRSRIDACHAHVVCAITRLRASARRAAARGQARMADADPLPRPRLGDQTSSDSYALGSVTPFWPWYLPPRSRYDVSHTSSDSRNSTCATPSLA